MKQASVSGFALTLAAVYILALVASMAIFRLQIAQSLLHALNGNLPNMALRCVPLLTSVMGASAVLSVAIGNLMGNVLLAPPR